MTSGSGPDLFVVCKHCGAEVSPYITECPYCGNRIQKRAPKLDRNGRIAEKVKARPPAPSLPRLRRGEIPGIRHDAHPYATITLVVLSFLGTLLWRAGALSYPDVVGHAALSPHPWHVLTAPLVYDNTGYAVICVGVIAIFGVLMEHRHGPIAVLVLFLLGGAAGAAASLALSHSYIVDGGNGAALALLVAWAIPDVVEAVAARDFEGDLLGVAVIGAVIALMPFIAPEASWISDAVRVAAGILIGYPLARLRPT